MLTTKCFNKLKGVSFSKLTSDELLFINGGSCSSGSYTVSRVCITLGGMSKVTYQSQNGSTPMNGTIVKETVTNRSTGVTTTTVYEYRSFTPAATGGILG